MKGKRFREEQIIAILKEAEAGLAVAELVRKYAISEQTYYRWRKEYGGMKTVQVKRLKDLERENGRLKKAVAELTLDKQILKEALEGNS